MYNYNWDEIKWIFKHDGSLLDIYIVDVSIEDWRNLIDYLNLNFVVKFGPFSEERSDIIDKEYAVKYLISDSDQIVSKSISIIIDDILINCHIFCETQIEFDIEPKEIKTSLELDKILNFMTSVSKKLNKQIILTGESQINFPLITIYKNGMMEYLTEIEAIKRWGKK
jgi:hypothetical protein